MTEYILNQAEMLVLMLTANTQLFIGIDNDRLVPNAQREQRRLTLIGIESLKKRRLLKDKSGQLIVDGTLGLIANALAYPELVTVISRDNADGSRQQFAFYRLDPAYVELTMPDEHTYRLVPLPDIVHMLERIRTILPVPTTNRESTEAPSMSFDAFLAIKEMAEKDASEATNKLIVNHAWQADMATQFAQTLHKPILGGLVTFLKVVDQKIVDGRDLAMVQNKTKAWLLYPDLSNKTMLEITVSTAVDYSTKLLQTVSQLLDKNSQ